jgi:branched-chain amino acid transport system ATP-binding protein
MLELRSIDVRYGKIQVLRDVALQVRPGEVVSLVGANSAGKTTTLRTILGLKELVHGEIRVDGTPVQSLGTPERMRQGLVLVPEGRQVFTRFTVAENLTIGAYNRRDRHKLHGEIDAIYQMFPRLAERRNQKAGSMSGGEQQMLAIGRGLMSKPRYLLLDEPTLGLAPIIVDLILESVRKLAASGMTILVAEQNAAFAFDISDRAYVIEGGRILLSGASADLKQSPDVRRLYLGG